MTMTLEAYKAQVQNEILKGETLLTGKDLARRWRVSPRTVQNWASGQRKDGIPLKKVGPCRDRYRLEDVVEFEYQTGLGV
jgi:hypothetical protein